MEATFSFKNKYTFSPIIYLNHFNKVGVELKTVESYFTSELEEIDITIEGTKEQIDELVRLYSAKYNDYNDEYQVEL